jgi:hypothetical protein
MRDGPWREVTDAVAQVPREIPALSTPEKLLLVGKESTADPMPADTPAAREAAGACLHTRSPSVQGCTPSVQNRTPLVLTSRRLIVCDALSPISRSFTTLKA